MSRNLSIFNKAKKELSNLIAEVSASVTMADKSLRQFKADANTSGKDLQDKIQEAKMLSDELELIYKSSNRVADRLEKLTEGSTSSRASKKTDSDEAEKKKTQKKSSDEDKADAKGVGWIKKKISKVKGAEDTSATGGGVFSIRDPDYESGLKESKSADNDDWDGPEEIETDAERQLYKALKKRRN